MIITITAADKRTLWVTAKEKLLIPNGDKGTSKVHLLNALYLPSMGVTLVSVSKITKSGSIVIFQGNYCQIYNQAKDRIGKIPERNGLYCVFMMNPKAEANSAEIEDKLSINELHCHLGHISQDQAKLLIQKGH